MNGDVRNLKMPDCWWAYVLTVLAVVAIIRAIHAFIRATERCGMPGERSFWKNFGFYYLGFGFGDPLQPERGGANDYLQPAILGVGELFVYPILMASGLTPYIGAWLGFKVIPRLASWSTWRNAYQRFLIGNALVLIASYVLMRYFIPVE